MGNIHQRYHVGCQTCGFLGGFNSFSAACKEGDLHDHGTMVSVFDSMANVGAWQLWEQDQEGWSPVGKRLPNE